MLLTVRSEGSAGKAVAILTLAPCFSNRRTTSGLRPSIARNRLVRPRESAAFGSAPWPSSSVTVSRSPVRVDTRSADIRAFRQHQADGFRIAGARRGNHQGSSALLRLNVDLGAPFQQQPGLFG